MVAECLPLVVENVIRNGMSRIPGSFESELWWEGFILLVFVIEGNNGIFEKYVRLNQDRTVDLVDALVQQYKNGKVSCKLLLRQTGG